MGILNRLFGTKAKKPLPTAISPASLPLGLSDPKHRARRNIDAAASLADTAGRLDVVGDRVLFSSLSPQAMKVVDAIDQAIQQAPDDFDLLIAKSAALCCAAQFKSAEEVIDEVLKAVPNNFEARQRKDHWEKWNHVMQYPPWFDSAKELHPAMARAIRDRRSVQLVRDGLQIGIAVVGNAELKQFPRGLSTKMRSKWELVWSETPHGVLIAHYLMVEDDPGGDPFRVEAFLPTFVPTEVDPDSGYWLLQRLNHMNSCFLVLVDGERVLYNARYIFPGRVKATLRLFAERVVQRAEGRDLSAFQRACQWHMSKFDMNSLRF